MKNLSILLILLMTMAFTTDKPAYLLYDADGDLAKYSKMIDKLKKADVVLFGELHNNPIAHWLELELAKDLSANKKKTLILAAEMFEADDQLIIDEYFSNQIQDKHLEKEAKIWDNYKTDYKPLVSFAKEKNLKFVAANIPRRYASLVAREGLKALNDLSPEAKNYIAPLPIEFDKTLPAYAQMFEMMGGAASHGMKTAQIVEAQAIKDATMAHNIAKNWKKKTTVLHYYGSYHSDNKESIVWYLNKYNPKLKVMTISTVVQDDISKLEEKSKNVADYIIAVPSTMTTTY